MSFARGDTMPAQLGSWWQKIKQHPYATGFIVLSILVLILFIYLAYRFGWEWTGFSSGTNHITITSTPKGNYTATMSQQSKSLWDWLNLLAVLAIPAVVGLGAAWFTAKQAQVSGAENLDNQRESALQGYIDKMSELLLEKNLRGSQPEDDVRTIARTRTLTILPRLDKERKRSVLQFLIQSDLLLNEEGKLVMFLAGADLSGANLSLTGLSKSALAGVNLRGADLSGTFNFKASLVGADLSGANLSRAKLDANLSRTNLQEVNLSYANLSGANLGYAMLIGADLTRANLSGANLSEANLSGANLSEADLSGANLSGANLSHANLIGADLIGADLTSANLSEAGVTREQLDKALSLEYTVMPDGV